MSACVCVVVNGSGLSQRSVFQVRLRRNALVLSRVVQVKGFLHWPGRGRLLSFSLLLRVVESRGLFCEYIGSLLSEHGLISGGLVRTQILLHTQLQLALLLSSLHAKQHLLWHLLIRIVFFLQI